MKKENLKDGMIIEIEWSEFSPTRFIKIGHRLLNYKGYINLEDIDENLITKNNKGKITKIFKNKLMESLKDMEYDSCLELIWERKKEIDWSKVPKWTPVQIKDNWASLINAYHLEYRQDKIYSHTYTTRDKFCFETDPVVDYCSEGRCEIHPSVEIQEEWYKEERF